MDPSKRMQLAVAAALRDPELAQRMVGNADIAQAVLARPVFFSEMNQTKPLEFPPQDPNFPVPWNLYGAFIVTVERENENCVLGKLTPKLFDTLVERVADAYTCVPDGDRSEFNSALHNYLRKVDANAAIVRTSDDIPLYCVDYVFFKANDGSIQALCGDFGNYTVPEQSPIDMLEDVVDAISWDTDPQIDHEVNASDYGEDGENAPDSVVGVWARTMLGVPVLDPTDADVDADGGDVEMAHGDEH